MLLTGSVGWNRTLGATASSQSLCTQQNKQLALLFLSGILYTQGGGSPKVVPDTKNVLLEWDDTHNPVLLTIATCSMARTTDPKNKDTLRFVKPSLWRIPCK